MTCKTCVWWTEVADSWNEIAHPVDEDTYEPKDIGYEVRLCKHPELTFCETPISADGFGVADGSNYMANLYTAESFGCVRHELSAQQVPDRILGVDLTEGVGS